MEGGGGGGQRTHTLPFKETYQKFHTIIPLHPIGRNIVTWPNLPTREVERGSTLAGCIATQLTIEVLHQRKREYGYGEQIEVHALGPILMQPSMARTVEQQSYDRECVTAGIPQKGVLA